MGQTSATIFNIQKFSTEDGPGIRTTVFFKGCPMRCPWCHNPEALRSQADLVWHGGRCIGHGSCVEVCPEEALSTGAGGIVVDRERCAGCALCVDGCPSSALELHGRTETVEEIFEAVMRDASFYDTSDGGVTLSGGEPLAQPTAALELMARLREARVLFAEISEQFPNYEGAPRALAALALTYYKEGDCAGTEQHYRALTDRYPGHRLVPEAWYHLGLCAERSGRATEAQEYFVRLSKTYPDTVYGQQAEERVKE